MEGFAYFPAIVYRDERPDFVEKLLPTCVEYLNSVRDENRSMTQSNFLVHDPVFREVSDYLLLSSVNLLRDQGYSVDKYDFYLSGLWAQETKKGAGTDVHVHNNSQMCGWLFLETPENGSYPVYYDSRMNKKMIELHFDSASDEITNATDTINFNNVNPGTVLFANSWLTHQISGSLTDLPTRCLHFIISHKDRSCNIC